MENISIRIDDDMMKELEKEEFKKRVLMLAGSSKRKSTDEQLHAVREKLAEELERKHNLK